MIRHVTIVLSLVASLAACHDTKPAPPPVEGERCLHCHEGIETAHDPLGVGQCVVCHGGNPTGTTKEDAHIPVPSNWERIRGPSLPLARHGFIRDFAPDQLDALDPAYIRFINPGDIRVLDATCGVCHPKEAATVPKSIMVTNAGHYYPTRLLAGLQPSPVAEYGSYAASDPDCDPTVKGSVCDLVPLRPPTGEDIAQAVASDDPKALADVAYTHYLSKNCNTCHQAGFSRNDAPGLFRSTGCTACHMQYGELGIYEGNDPTIPKGTPVHPRTHRITSSIEAQQCATCHFQGGRIGLLFRGIREGGFSAEATPPHAVPLPGLLYGHAPGYYFEDEDATNSIDETPPDLHYSAGMACVDCHVGSDVHGDGRLYSSSKHQLDLRCEDCHGSVRQRATPRADGRFYTAGGRPLPQLQQGAQGEIYLVGRVDGQKHIATQPAGLLAQEGEASAEMHAAMGPDTHGWSHTDSLTCDTCHTSYNQFCIGCHVSLDLRLSQVDYQTGVSTPGLTRGSRTYYSLEHVLLGTAPDGRVQSVVPSQQVQMAVVGAAEFGSLDGEVLLGAKVEDEDGETRLVGEFRDTHGFAANNGFAPFFQHTTTATPRTCVACHRQDDSVQETNRVRGVYGFGTGEFMLDAPDGRQVDGLQFLDSNGNALTTWTHPDTGPLSPARLERALGVVVKE